ncbi:MAG: bifunctional adenosylcobinamide kinase/adenosylcobinamide-phosphate guanylyltransferase [Anaerolineae bacterium]
MAGRVILLLGGARSGKSRTAEQWARERGGRVLFIATAQAFDDEMRERIAQHRAERPPDWDTLELPLRMATLPPLRDYDVVILDCVTLLASNALLALPDDCTQAEATAAVISEVEALLRAAAESRATWLIISNEVGMGIVPPYRLGRLYRDALGGANQRLATHADEVYLLVAGIPWRLK